MILKIAFILTFLLGTSTSLKSKFVPMLQKGENG